MDVCYCCCCCRTSYLHIASQLSGGIETSLSVLAEPESCLSSEADSVSVAVVDAACDGVDEDCAGENDGCGEVAHQQRSLRRRSGCFRQVGRRR